VASATSAPSPTLGPTPAPTAQATATESLAPNPSVPASNLVEVAAGGGSADPAGGGIATNARIQ